MPKFLTVLAFVAATRINRPLKLWRSRAPARLRNLLAKLWPWSLIISVISFLIAVETVIFGDPLLGFVAADTAYTIQFSLGLDMLMLAIVALPAANAHNAQSY